jgi:hypothetical protein
MIGGSWQGIFTGLLVNAILGAAIFQIMNYFSKKIRPVFISKSKNINDY